MRHHYIGIADAHGLESFSREDDASSDRRKFLQLRASLNRQRHACFYQLDLNSFEAALIEKLCDKRMYKSALRILKQHPDIMIEKHCKDSWEKIPDSKLDPWHSQEEDLVDCNPATNSVEFKTAEPN
jgi:hypothetical protein